MRLLENIHRKATSTFNDNFQFIIYLALVFFIFDSANIYKLKSENKILVNELEDHTISIKESIEVARLNIVQNSKLRASTAYIVPRVVPFQELMDSYKIGSGNLSSFLNMVKDELMTLEVGNLGPDQFEGLESLISLSKKYPELENYVLSSANLEFALRTQSVFFGGSSTCLTTYRPFSIVEVIGDQYQFYPNNFQVSRCYSQIKVNGNKAKDDYLWKPTRRGMHYFDVEYIDFEGHKIKKKNFRVGLKVI